MMERGPRGQMGTPQAHISPQVGTQAMIKEKTLLMSDY